MSSIANIDPYKCTLTLYYADKRIADNKWYDANEITISHQIAERANDIVTAYFGVDQEWDKKLFKCIFLDDADFDWFEFHRIDVLDVTLGVRIGGNRNVVFNASPEEFYVPIEKPAKISVSIKSVFGSVDYELNYDQIKNKGREVYSIVALFNSQSFKRASLCSTNSGFSRRLEKLDVNPVEAKKL